MGNLIFPNAPPHSMLVNPHMAGSARHMAPQAQTPLPFIAPRPPMASDIPPGGMPHHLQHHMHQQPIQMQGLPLHAEQLYHQGQPIPLQPHQVPYMPLSTQNPHVDPTTFQHQTWQQSRQETVDLNSFNQPPLISPVGYESIPTTAEASAAHVPINPAQWPSGDQGPDVTRIPVPHEAVRTFINEEGKPARFIYDEETAYWHPDDDASMAASEDEEGESEDEAQHLESNDLGAIVARRLHNRPPDAFGTQMRTFSNFADANVLATYIPSSINSPLNDAQTASVFWYFVNVTGPSMSLFERRPVDPTPIFQGQPVPRSRQHIWTYTFPIIALNHPALLQAMLALGSLQMARLQGAPHTASMKHYHLSLRRIARNCGSPSRRVQPATLAATMLLGFYEVWNSDHDKWCKHLWGARAILREIPIRDMTKRIIALKRQQRQYLNNSSPEAGKDDYANKIVAERDIDQVDTALVAQLSGRPVAYDDSTPPAPVSSAAPLSWTAPQHYTEKDIETYELIADVFWWYCKMDVYQSILGGTPLLMEYGCWTQCTPRAPISKIDAIYGTYDHLILLLGRLCSFASKDQSRKRKMMRSDGLGGGQGQSPPGFVGMMPSTGHITIPKGFSPPREVSPQSDKHDDVDIEARTAAAMREWEAIRQTFEVFRAQLGPGFEPLGPEFDTPVSSPFGPALKYRTYSIAGIWMNYYMGLIVLHRCYPTMPPIAMVAAGMAAQQTAPFAIQIGRIVAGIGGEDMGTMSSVSTLLGCVSIESSFPLFVAAVQYQDTAQRHWTVRRMHNVARLTGWQSARQIANGCESGWVKAANLGRGPPYESPPDLEAAPLSIWNQPRRIIDRVRELEDVEERLVLSTSERPHYAVGLLSVETDLERLDLSDHE
ncbi:hypothetical protein HMPREF1624_02126 [Sporothrix schenckii ATCC 58251]|uniref:Transcription factor domain-containing protein n=1 Tax=Sporothrix schenckii (strain ATCC 58251 / de Perez 2211183) TaxID=1391915 RepID=U7Q153_SPOS1|nr:hypothetical protein HMPREF1624_02126 [Sporothrix schenckii ATCC 58251]